MLAEVEKFKNSGKQFTSRDIIESYTQARGRLVKQWEATLPDDKEGRELTYHKLKAMDDMIIQLIFDWSK